MLARHDGERRSQPLVACSQRAPQELVCSLTRLLDELSAQDRLVLSLCYTDRLADAETAEILRIPSRRVAQARTSAEKHLRDALVASYPTLRGES